MCTCITCRAKKQLVVKQALRDWFEAARDGSNGVAGAELVDAIVTLGLNGDHKQVGIPRLHRV